MPVIPSTLTAVKPQTNLLDQDRARVQESDTGRFAMGRFDRRRLRRWATTVLGAWLFVFVAGIAHACVLPSSGHGVADGAAFAAAPPTPHMQEATATGGHDDPAMAAQANCSRFCDGEARNVPPANLPSDPWLHGALPPPVAWILPAPPTEVHLQAAAGAWMHPAPQMPAAIAFLRLTL